MRITGLGLGFLGETICALMALLPAVGQRSDPPMHWEQYTMTNGLPSNRVLCVAVDADRVWAGTDNGLVLIERGQVAKVFQPQDGLVARVVTALAIDQDTGDLWIGAYGGLGHYSAGVFQNYASLTSGLANDIVYDVAVQHGVVWAATAAGLSRLDIRSGSWTNFDNRNTPMMDPWPVAVSVNEDKAFVATWGSGVLEYNIATDRWTSHREGDGDKTQHDAPVAESILDFATGAAYDSKSGVLWIATRGGLVRRDDHTWSRYNSENSGLASNFINALRLYDNKLWLCTKKDLSVFSLKTSKWTTYHVFVPSRRQIAVAVERGFARRPAVGRTSSESNVLNVAFHGTDIWAASEAGLSHGTLIPAANIKRSKHAAEIRDEIVDSYRLSSVASPSKQLNYSLDHTTANIGFFGPVEGSRDIPYGMTMLHGAQLAVDEANDHGRSSDLDHTTRLRYELTIHNDSAPWGASTTEPVNMAMDEHIVAILGSIDGSTTHTMLRIATELGVPVVNTGTTDPSIADTRAPGFVRMLPDDRQQSRALVKYIVGQKSIRKVGVLREDARYARVGFEAFSAEIVHSGQISLTSATFQPGDTDFSRQIQEFRAAKIDGIVIWCRPTEAALILRQMRASGMQIPALGPSYLVSPQLIEFAGTAAEGLVATSVLNPTIANKRWQDFEKSYRYRFGESPDSYASYAYDGINLLIAAIEKSGPNRERIEDVLSQQRLGSYQGVSGQISFDGNLNNIAPITMARVQGGRFVYWVPNAVR